jgi:hypothetical protein
MKAFGVVLFTFMAGCSAGDDVPAPIIASIVPDHASPGTAVTIQGDWFCGQPEPDGEEAPLACANIGTVTFGETPTNIGTYTDHMIIAEVPDLAPASYAVAISVAGRRSNTRSFLVDGP